MTDTPLSELVANVLTSNAHSAVRLIDTGKVRDITPDVIGPDGRMKILPAEYWATTNAYERALFGVRHGIYSYPTTELVELLRGFIGDRVAIEIGAGNGVLAEALGIVATDNYQYHMPKYQAVAVLTGQAIPPYGPNVIRMDAYRAVRRYNPDVVIGCWVTHKYDPARHDAGGNEIGIDEWDILQHCDAYLVVGNEKIHQGKAIWSHPSTVTHPPYIYSRALNGAREFIAMWRGTRRD